MGAVATLPGSGNESEPVDESEEAEDAARRRPGSASPSSSCCSGEDSPSSQDSRSMLEEVRTPLASGGGEACAKAASSAREQDEGCRRYKSMSALHSPESPELGLGPPPKHSSASLLAGKGSTRSSLSSTQASGSRASE
jgi:hypothetical protein